MHIYHHRNPMEALVPDNPVTPKKMDPADILLCLLHLAETIANEIGHGDCNDAILGELRRQASIIAVRADNLLSQAGAQ